MEDQESAGNIQSPHKYLLNRKKGGGNQVKPRSDAMDSEGTDMMDTETATSGTNQDQVIKDLLTLARQLINQGQPSQALQAVSPIHIQFPNSLFVPIYILSSFF